MFDSHWRTKLPIIWKRDLKTLKMNVRNTKLLKKLLVSVALYCGVMMCTFVRLLYICDEHDVFVVMKVISSTCPPSSKTAGSSSGRNMECSSCWIQFAFTMGKTTSPTIPQSSAVSLSVMLSPHDHSLFPSTF